MSDTLSQAEVRAWLGECVQELDEVARGYTKTGEDIPARWSHYAACARRALALLDEGRKQKEQVRGLPAWETDGGNLVLLRDVVLAALGYTKDEIEIPNRTSTNQATHG